MNPSHNSDPALPDGKPSNATPARIEPHNPNDLLPDPDPNACVRNVNAPDLGGSFEENGQRRLHDGVGAGPGMQVLDEALEAAKKTERHSSAGS